VPATERAARRLPPEERSAQILAAARRVLTRDGITRFSLEAVAREAGVAATLPRHYFESRDGLLAAALLDVLQEFTEMLTVPGPDLPDRLRAYIAHLAQNAWGHALWVNSANLSPDVDEAFSAVRRQMIEGAYRRRWEDMTPLEQLTASGFIGYFNDVVTAWLEQGADDQELVVSALLDGARRLGVKGA
jgi:AcrR family transcriptional regulator